MKDTVCIVIFISVKEMMMYEAHNRETYSPLHYNNIYTTEKLVFSGGRTPLKEICVILFRVDCNIVLLIVNLIIHNISWMQRGRIVQMV